MGRSVTLDAPSLQNISDQPNETQIVQVFAAPAAVGKRPAKCPLNDPLKTMSATVDFEMCRLVLEGALGRPPRWKGGRPPFDSVLKFRMLVLQSLHRLSLEQTDYLVRDRLS